MLDFRSVDRNNFRDILKLSVGEGQEHFVATNAYSLSQAKAQPEGAEASPEDEPEEKAGEGA